MNEKRLIDANALMAKIKNSTASKAVKGVACIFVNDAPTIDAVEVVHGRWIPQEYSHTEGNYHLFHCSECGIPNAFERSYCPNCGAKMDGDGNETF